MSLHPRFSWLRRLWKRPIGKSLALHVAVLLLAVFGLPRISRAPETISAVQVTLVGQAEAPDVPAAAAPAPAPKAPEPKPEPPATRPQPPAPPVNADLGPEDAAPEPGEVPDLPATPPPPVKRVTPTPSPETPLPKAPVPVPPVSSVPSPAPAEPRPVEPPAAPEESSPQVVTEAVETEEVPTPVAPTSPRPAPRPERKAPPPAPVQEAEATPEPAPAPAPKKEEPPPEPAPETVRAPDPEPEPDPAPSDPIADAIAEALSEAQTAPAPQAQPRSGPPMTGSERDAFMVAVSQCWNFNALSTEGAQVTVTVSMEMTPDGRPVQSSLRMSDYSGGSRDAAENAYEAARRAILGCQGSGYPLPVDKYDQWRQIELVFNPERMRLR